MILSQNFWLKLLKMKPNWSLWSKPLTEWLQMKIQLESFNLKLWIVSSLLWIVAVLEIAGSVARQHREVAQADHSRPNPLQIVNKLPRRLLSFY